MNYKKEYDEDELKRKFGELCYNWHYKKIIEIKKALTKKELEIIKKLEVEI